MTEGNRQQSGVSRRDFLKYSSFFATLAVTFDPLGWVNEVFAGKNPLPKVVFTPLELPQHLVGMGIVESRINGLTSDGGIFGGVRTEESNGIWVPFASYGMEGAAAPVQTLANDEEDELRENGAIVTAMTDDSNAVIECIGPNMVSSAALWQLNFGNGDDVVHNIPTPPGAPEGASVVPTAIRFDSQQIALSIRPAGAPEKVQECVLYTNDGFPGQFGDETHVPFTIKNAIGAEVTNLMANGQKAGNLWNKRGSVFAFSTSFGLVDRFSKFSMPRGKGRTRAHAGLPETPVVLGGEWKNRYGDVIGFLRYANNLINVRVVHPDRTKAKETRVLDVKRVGENNEPLLLVVTRDDVNAQQTPLYARLEPRG